MNQDVKSLWVDALRSGEFTQGKGALRTKDNKYCCLGVLCELYLRQTNDDVSWKYDDVFLGYGLYGEKAVLPNKVIKWSGIVNYNGKIIDNNVETNLVSLNDKGCSFKGCSFNEIADLIEKQY